MNTRKAFMQSVNKSQQLFHKINNYTCIAGLLNLWDDSVDVPKIATKTYYKVFFNLTTFSVFLLITLEVFTFLKIDKLNVKQIYDWIMFSMAQPLMFSMFLSVHYYKANLKHLLLCLTVQLKNAYNDQTVERRMMKRAKFYIIAYLSLTIGTLTMYGTDSFIQVINSDETFTTVITVWPDVEDKSNMATFARIVYYLIWWVLMSRSSTAYVIATATTTCLSHQFKNLQTYFYGLEDIFKEEELTQLQKEQKYEKGFEFGIKMHSDTLWCYRQCQIVFSVVYSGQLMLNLTAMVILMLQMVTLERTFINVTSIVTTALAVLVTTAVFMWNAGDVTVEASNLATAMYSSGWENCRRASSTRVRKLLVIAMTQAQEPVIIKVWGIVELSYQSYLTIVKSSYSVFSLLY